MLSIRIYWACVDLHIFRSASRHVKRDLFFLIGFRCVCWHFDNHTFEHPLSELLPAVIISFCGLHFDSFEFETWCLLGALIFAFGGCHRKLRLSQREIKYQAGWRNHFRQHWQNTFISEIECEEAFGILCEFAIVWEHVKWIGLYGLQGGFAFIWASRVPTSEIIFIPVAIMLSLWNIHSLKSRYFFPLRVKHSSSSICAHILHRIWKSVARSMFCTLLRFNQNI